MHSTSAPDNNGYTSDSIDLSHRGATLADKVYEQLFGWISNGQYARQSKLPSENELARSFDVSRPVIRDALKRLRDDGVIYSRQGAGSFVLGPETGEGIDEAVNAGPLFTPAQTIADIQRCFEFRETIEGRTAALAALRRNGAILDELAAILERLKHATADHVHRDDIDLEFHLTIAKAANNHYFLNVLYALREQITVGMKLHGMALLQPSARLEQSTEEHGEILEAIRAGDAERASEAMRAHVRNSRDRLFGGGLIDLSL
ncbi:FadR family transcriptional regulator [Sphingomonas sp. BT-65]|uniref:FadR/GntR family transcriptional regulator n=1 Tax=Sphingomonas sp. BT-65 TaxID=2989821 RepID=UPI0022356FF6|nr:FadR/GntR family transcriptional regulator [Sphingomonas sp. BT-65]MCW4462894.1 FadR family transcriptional regulator [Sphingomonas sp. BT-65]